MGRLSWKTGGVYVTLIASSLTVAQTPFNVDASASKSDGVVVGGTMTVDLIRLKGTSPGAPLRFGNVVPKSETVSLDGVPLILGQDYSMDYESGVVYLMRAQRPGQSLTVSYRYLSRPKSGDQSTKGIGSFKFDLVPGGLKMMMGLGMAERQKDGTVVTSNVYGLNNRFSFGGSTLSGVYLMGNREKQENRSAFEYQGQGASNAGEGDSTFNVQNLTTNLGSGKLYVDYQDISKNFSGFNQVEAAGYNAQQVNQFRREKGLGRMGYGIQDFKLGSGKVSANMRSVEDDNGNISWRDLALSQGGFSFGYKSQEVGEKFSRFNDIREQDRMQLKKEAGLSRENLTMGFANKLGALTYATDTVADKDSNSISRSTVKLDTSKIKFTLQEQKIDKDFKRTESLFEAERKQWGRELGMNRQNVALEAAIFGKVAGPLKFNQGIVEGKEGSFKSQDIGLGGKGWSLSRASRSVDEKFTNLPNLAESEWNDHMRAITSMYDAKGFAYRPEERGRFFASAGLDREVTRLTAEPFKSWNLNAERLEIAGKEGGAQVDTASLASKMFSVDYRRQKVSDKFGEFANLMQFEQQRLGVISGLDRTDLGFKANLGKRGQFEFGQMQASAPIGDASRQSMKFTDKKLQVEVNQREVSKDFDNVGQIQDTEKDLLLTLKGFKQRDTKVKWEILPNLKLDYFDFSATSSSVNQDRIQQQTSLAWAPNAKFNASYFKYVNNSNDPLSVLMAQNLERVSIYKDFDRLGRFTYVQEKQDFDGIQATSLADMRKTYLSYEKQIDQRTSVRTERTETEWDNGERENVNANTLSTKLGNKAGVSVTDLRIDRKGEDRDETKRNYGFWYEVAKNLRVGWGYARHLNGETSATMNSTATVSSTPTDGLRPDQVGQVPGATLGNMTVGAGYGVNRWEQDGINDRTQAFSNVNLAMVKPARLGFVNDFTFKFAYDTAADQFNWLRENRMVEVGGKIGSNAFGYGYKSQMSPTGYRAIDRTFSFQTRMSENAKLRGSIFYKVRTLPDTDKIMIRNISLSARPFKNLEITNQILTNPEVARGDVLLGSIVQGANMNRWRADYKSNPNFTWGGTWEQMFNEQSRAFSTTSGLNVTLFERSGSPITLFFGGEETGGNIDRRYSQRYSIGFNQRPGRNQQLGLFIGNLSYLNGKPTEQKRNNYTMRVDYQLRF